MNPHLMFPPYRQLLRSLCLGSPHLDYLDIFMDKRHHENCRIAVLDFGVGSNDMVKCVKSSFAPGCLTNVQHFLNDFTSDGLPHRRLFLVEDLTTEVIEALGFKFNINPAFFAGHIRVTEGDTINAVSSAQRLPSLCDPHKEFVLKYWEIFGPSKDIDRHGTDPGGRRKAKFSNVDRTEWIRSSLDKGNNQEKELALVRHKASYWSRTYGDIDEGSWDAVMLVDPPYQYRCQRHHRHSQHPHGDTAEFFHHGYTDFTPWAESLSIPDRLPKQPARTSIFDDIVFYSLQEWPLSNLGLDPGDAAIFLRRIVVSIWMVSIEFLRRNYGTVQLDDLDFTKLSAEEIQKNIRNLHKSTALTVRFWTHAKQNLFNLGIAPKDAKYYVRYPEGRLPGNQPGQKKCHHRYRSSHKWKLEDDEVDWIFVFNEIESWRKKYAGLTNIQLQALSIYDTQQESSYNGYFQLLTWLGAIFLPMSLLASIFSIAEDFAPGKPKFWVFWAVAVPVLILGLIFIETARPNSSINIPGLDIMRKWKR